MKFSKAMKNPRSCCWSNAFVRNGRTKSRQSFTSTALWVCRPSAEIKTNVFYGLLEEFDAIPGVPVFLNTSLNVRGDPIVEPPADALACFLGTGIDYLALHDMLIAKNRFHRIFSPFRSAYSEMSSVVQRGLAVEMRD